MYMRICTKEFCSSKHHAKGLCTKHYHEQDRQIRKEKIAKRRKKYRSKNRHILNERNRLYLRRIRAAKQEAYNQLVKRRRHEQGKRRASKLKRIPKWITQKDLKEIKAFIENCPKTHHVDHCALSLC